VLACAGVPARYASALGLLPALLAPKSAAAEPSEPPLSLTVSAPPECPSRQALQAEALRLARVGPDFTRKLTAEIGVERAGARFSLRLHTDFDGVAGERSFEGSSCQAVSDAAVLTLALMLNPDVETDADPAPSAGESETKAAPPPEPGPPKQEPRRPIGGRDAGGPRLEGAVAAYLGAELGILPALGPEIGAALGLSLRPITVWLGVSYAKAQDVTLSDGQGGRLWAGSASLLGCWAIPAGPSATIEPCAGAELDRVEGHGTGVTDPETGAIFGTSAVAGLSASIELAPRLSLRGSVQGLVPLGAPRVFLEDIGQIHQPGPVLGRAHAGLSLGLW